MLTVKVFEGDDLITSKEFTTLLGACLWMQRMGMAGVRYTITYTIT